MHKVARIGLDIDAYALTVLNPVAVPHIFTLDGDGDLAVAGIVDIDLAVTNPIL